MKNYQKLKPKHFSQDKNDGCSLASFLIVKNTILNAKQTQVAFRKELDKLNSIWVTRVSGARRGVQSKILQRYISDYLGQAMSDWTAEIKSIPKFKRLAFKRFLLEANDKEDFYILFNYNAHYSPFGKIENDEIHILDTDYYHQYKEYYYDVNEGVTTYNFDIFYNFCIRQKRSFLIIRKK